MLTIFNRKQLVSTFSMKQHSEIRNKLQANSIKYKCKVINRNSASPISSSRVRTGSLGQNMDMAYEYIFFVHKQDYSKAKDVIR